MLNINLPPDVEMALSDEASRHGLPISEYVVTLLSARLAPRSGIASGAELAAYWRKEGLIGARQADKDSPVVARQIRRMAERRGRAE